jgi:hypothetical protein
MTILSNLESMGWDTFNIFSIAMIIAIYIPTFILCLIFTFSIKLFQKIEERVSTSIIPCPYITPLDTNITYFNEWLIERHYIIGPFMSLICFYDIVALFDLARALNF